MRCVIFQNKIEIHHFKKNYNIFEFKIIAWNSEVIDELDKLNLKYICAGSIYKDRFNVKQRISLIKQYGKINNILDEIVKKHVPSFKNNNISPFNCISSLNRNFFLTYIMDIEIIYNLKKNFNFKSIYYYKYNVSGYYGLLSRVIDLFSNKKNYFKKLILKINSKHISKDNYINLEFNLKKKFQNLLKEYYINLNISSKTNKLQNFWRILINLTKKILTRDDYKNHLYSIFSNFIKFQNKNKNILFFTDYRNQKKFKQQLEKNGYKIIYLSDLYLNINKKYDLNFNSIYNEIENSKKFKQACSYKSKNFYKYIRIDLKLLIEDFLPKLLENLDFFEALEKKYKFNSILTEYNFPICEMILSRKKNTTPIYVDLHGGTVGVYNAQPFQIDYNRIGGKFLNYFVYTNKIRNKQKLNFHNSLNQANYYSVGSLYHKEIFDTFYQKQVLNNKINICLVVTQFAKVGDNTIGIYREVNTYKLIKSILNIFDKVNNSKFNFFLKCGYNIENRNLDIFNNYKNINVLNSNVSIKRVLEISDIFILPSFSSIFFELACTKKSVFLNLDKKVHSFDKSAELAINKRANVSYDEQKFLKKIKDITNYGWKSKFLSNNKEKDLSFYKLYCNKSKDPVNDRIKILKKNSERSRKKTFK